MRYDLASNRHFIFEPWKPLVMLLAVVVAPLPDHCDFTCGGTPESHRRQLTLCQISDATEDDNSRVRRAPPSSPSSFAGITGATYLPTQRSAATSQLSLITAQRLA